VQTFEQCAADPRHTVEGEIFTKVSGYVLGDFLTFIIAGFGSCAWLTTPGARCPVPPAGLVALFGPADAGLRPLARDALFRGLDTS